MATSVLESPVLSPLVRLLKKPFFGPYQRRWTWPDGVDVAAWHRVTFPGPRRANLVGLHGHARGPRRGVAVIPNPMVAEAKAFCLTSGHAEFLRDAGFDVLAFDMNGFGESADASFDFPGDIRAAGCFAATLAPNTPVVLFGLSMGAGHGLSAMDHEDNPYRAAVLEGAFTTLGEFWRRYRVAYAVLRAWELAAPRAARELRPIDRAASVRRVERVMLIYGARDRATPATMGERLLAALPLAPDRKVLYVVDGARHLQALEVGGAAYRRRVLSFLDAAVPRASAN